MIWEVKKSGLKFHVSKQINGKIIFLFVQVIGSDIELVSLEILQGVQDTLRFEFSIM